MTGAMMRSVRSRSVAAFWHSHAKTEYALPVVAGSSFLERPILATRGFLNARKVDCNLLIQRRTPFCLPALSGFLIARRDLPPQ
jgi:hypothetical protein